jgi:hypothetical protein
MARVKGRGGMALLALSLPACASSVTTRMEVPVGEPTTRLVRTERPSALAADWRVDSDRIHVEVRWADACSLESTSTVRDRDVTTFTPDPTAGAIGAIAGAAMAIGGAYLVFMKAPELSDERVCDEKKNCSSPRTNAYVIGTSLLLTGTSIAVGSALLAGSEPWTHEKNLTTRTRTDRTAPRACAAAEDLEGMEIVLLAPTLGDPHATLDANGAADVKLPLDPAGAPPSAPLEIMRVGTRASAHVAPATPLGRIDLAAYRAKTAR